MAAFKRKVLYLSGFDPRGARFYHGLLGGELAAHNAAQPHAAAALSARRKGDTEGLAHWDARDVQDTWSTECEFLGWDDLVRRAWIKSPLVLLARTVGAYWRFITRLDWSLGPRVPKGSKVALFYPGATMLVLPLVLAGVLALALSLAVAWPWALLGGFMLAIGVTLVLLPRIHSLWLVRFVIFNDALARDGPTPELEARLDIFAGRVAAALREDWDEVLLVTHSNGSMLAVPLMLRLIAHVGAPLPERFGLVTLGACQQLVAARRDARVFHRHCEELAHHRFAWLDVGSLTDGACVPLVDPFLGRPVPRPPVLKQLSPRWFKYCDPAKYKARRRNKYETHFDYLRRLDKPSPIDYLGLTCSARPLRESIAAFEAEHG